jgi:hypothetical protein
MRVWPSTLVILLPPALLMYRGMLSTFAHARTGLLTPPGIHLRACSKSFCEASCIKGS